MEVICVAVHDSTDPSSALLNGLSCCCYCPRHLRHEHQHREQAQHPSPLVSNPFFHHENIIIILKFCHFKVTKLQIFYHSTTINDSKNDFSSFERGGEGMATHYLVRRRLLAPWCQFCFYSILFNLLLISYLIVVLRFLRRLSVEE